MNWTFLRTTSLATRASRFFRSGLGRAGAGQGLRSRCPDQPPRPRLCRRAVLQHRFGHRPGRQQAARRHPPRRSAADQFQPALSRPGARARHGLLARSPTLAVVSIGSELGHLHRHGDQRGASTSPMSGARPHEAFFTPDGKEVWVTVRGEDYVAVLDGATFEEKTRIKVPNGPGMHDLLARRQIRLCLLVLHSGDGSSSPSPTTRSSAHVQQASPFCPNIAATPDGKQVWFTLKDTGKTAGVRRAAALRPAEDARHRPDHQPRQLRTQCARACSPM